MAVGRYKFRLRVSLILLLGLPSILFVYLGLWQLDRAAEKHRAAEMLEKREQLAPAVITQSPLDGESLRFRSVQATGELEGDDSIFIENRRHAGKVGFHVITPLRIKDSDTRVLVNRGWVAADDRNQPPAVSTPRSEVEINGAATIPSPPAISLHAGSEAARQWGNRWPYLTLGLYAATVDFPVQGLMILQDPGDAHGFVRSWPKDPPKEGMHLGYAIQWFTFAVIALGLMIKLSMEKRKPEEISA